MGKSWTDRGHGQWKLVITDDATGAVLSTFYGTKEEIADKQADSLASAGRRITELRSNNGHTAPAPKPLSAAERMQTVSDLGNPATVDQGVLRVVESVVGPVSELRQDREAERMERFERAAISTAEAFADDTPDWYPSDYNKNVLVRYMQTQGLNPTNPAHYTQAFEALTAAQLLQPKPAEPPEPESINNEPPPAPERNAPAPTRQASPAPTRYSTSIRHSDISGTRPGGTTVRLKYSREQIARMGASKYKELMTSDPELTRCVEYYAKQDAAKQQRRLA
jgi:hypothetical protein